MTADTRLISIKDGYDNVALIVKSPIVFHIVIRGCLDKISYLYDLLRKTESFGRKIVILSELIHIFKSFVIKIEIV